MKELLLTTKDAAEYLGVKRSALTMAITRGRIEVAKKGETRKEGNLLRKSDLDKYKKESDDYGSVKSFASKSGHQWTFDGGKTAIRLMKYCQNKGYDNAWEGVRDLIEEHECKLHLHRK